MKPLEKPTEVELLNPSATFRQSKDGNRYRVSFEVERDLWQLFESPSPGLRLRGLLWIADDDESDRAVMQAAIEKPKKGSHGQYWAKMHVGCYFDVPGVVEALECERGDKNVAAAMRQHFGVKSRAEISPDELEAWASRHSLDSLITLSRNAQVRI
jgi:hypothetical protein